MQSTVLVIVVVIVVVVVVVPLGGSLSPKHFDLFACTSEIDAFVPILSGETRKRYSKDTDTLRYRYFPHLNSTVC